jgi:hypothetical protein
MVPFRGWRSSLIKQDAMVGTHGNLGVAEEFRPRLRLLLYVALVCAGAARVRAKSIPERRRDAVALDRFLGSRPARTRRRRQGYDPRRAVTAPIVTISEGPAWSGAPARTLLPPTARVGKRSPYHEHLSEETREFAFSVGNPQCGRHDSHLRNPLFLPPVLLPRVPAALQSSSLLCSWASFWTMRRS